MPTILDQVPAPRALPPGRADLLRAQLVEHARRHPEADPRPYAGSSPRAPRRTLRWTRLVPVGVAAAGAAVAVALNVAAPAPAYASWTASPTAMDPDQMRTEGAACVADVRSAFPSARADLAPVVGERRGDFRTSMVAAGDQVSVCAEWLGERSEDHVQTGNTLDGLVTDAVLPKDAEVALLAVPGQTSGTGAARVAFGLVSPRVKRLVVTTVTGTEVTATVANGYFLAWWPSGAEVATLTSYDAAGRATTTTP